MRQDPTILMTPDDIHVQETCVVCGHKCHCGGNCTEEACTCGTCYHEVAEVEDYISIEENQQ
jgi:hypothetical protein